MASFGEGGCEGGACLAGTDYEGGVFGGIGERHGGVEVRGGLVHVVFEWDVDGFDEGEHVLRAGLWGVERGNWMDLRKLWVD